MVSKDGKVGADASEQKVPGQKDRLTNLMNEALEALEGIQKSRQRNGSAESAQSAGLSEIEVEPVEIHDTPLGDEDQSAAGKDIRERRVAPPSDPTLETPAPTEDVTQIALKYKERADQYYKQLLRIAADFDNFRKRATAERQRVVETANEKLFTELLPILDDFERAMGHIRVKAQNDPAFQGMEMIQGRLGETLTRFGLRRFNSTGKVFDPNFHQAISTRATDLMEPNRIVEEYQAGYLLHERLLRPAMVIVAKAPETGASAPARPAQEPLDAELAIELADAVDDGTLK